MNDIFFSENSVMDDFGRVFFHDDKIYRGITAEATPECLIMLNSLFFKELESKGYVPKTQISKLKIDGYDLVLEHEKLAEILQQEWTFSMLKDASMMIFDIHEICLKYGYELKDAHTANVLFRGGQPVYIDIGSFQKKTRECWYSYFEFVSCFILPLCFWAQGDFFIAKKLLDSKPWFLRTIPNQNILDSGLFDILSYKIVIDRHDFLIKGKKYFSTKRKNIFVNSIKTLGNKMISLLKNRPSSFFMYRYMHDYQDYVFVRNVVENLRYPSAYSQWEDYHSKSYMKDGNIVLSYRFKRILEIINSIIDGDEITSLLDLAGNEGIISFEVEKYFPTIKKITLTDYDENALEKACLMRKENNSQINIALLNLMLTPNMENVSKRLGSDIVMALAITHHLILTSHFVLPAIFERIQILSHKYVLVEFMPKGLWSSENPDLFPSVPDWYHVDWFREIFIQYFDLVLEEELEMNRIIFVGKRK